MNKRIKKDITGKKFNQLTVIRFIEYRKCQSYWECICDCGNIKVTNISSLLLSRTKSCGCLRIKEFRKKMRKLPGEASIYRLFSEYKQAAKKRNIIFELSKEQFEEIVKKSCTFCGIKPFQVHQADKTCSQEWRNISKLIHSGVDRFDNTKGYTIDNSVPCCKYCNIAKHTMTFEQFKDWLDLIINQRKNNMGIWEEKVL